jgi:hypothetical protein
MIRSLTLFVHVVGVLALFVGLGLEWLALEAVRRSTSRAEAIRWVGMSTAAVRSTGIAFAVILASGLYLGGRAGVLGDPWLRASYSALLVMAVVAGPITRPRIKALQRAALGATDGEGTAIRTAASHSILRISLRVRVAFALAVVYLMIGKPPAVDSLVVLSLAAIVAIVMAVSKRPAPSTLTEGYR